MKITLTTQSLKEIVITAFSVGAEIYFLEEPIVGVVFSENVNAWMEQGEQQRDVEARTRWIHMIQTKIADHNAAFKVEPTTTYQQAPITFEPGTIVSLSDLQVAIRFGAASKKLVYPNLFDAARVPSEPITIRLVSRNPISQSEKTWMDDIRRIIKRHNEKCQTQPTTSTEN